MLPQFGKLLIIIGVTLIIVGILLLFVDRIPFFGRLPGDIVYRGKHTVVYIPLASMIVVSLLLTLLLSLFGRGK